MKKNRILIIEDEVAIADILEYGLIEEGYFTKIAHTGTDGLKVLADFQPDLLILDWMLPDQSGLDICKKVTATYNIPILMITAKSDITDKILGLEFGADDYITKPFDMREVNARIRTILRRFDQAVRSKEEAVGAGGPVLRFKDIEIVTRERLVRKAGKEIELTPKEYDLLLRLYSHRGKIYTRSELLDDVWGYFYSGDTRTVDTHIQRLRKKLDISDLITTVFSIGYKFNSMSDL
ncbi:two-component system, OmpR family, alkaline phosphatase synthesis response regulator PhoP [Paenibacillus sp. UNCCL117]|uniref:response regulator transcription factor n=1 Tax=unclassified Paenibacillus TaxID=185978 RepID=UPI000884723C|nr:MULTISPECIES: response regulator transcription factor [unclassified Paenibacillus]SDE14659.1 two-component system, OmpR family, alkaline phosphatase synthesis response regulator PhoP [Paenibacillus sp. cl123]SFW60661.1 two-component system, OmpR family, alkaline phosphatase synthesis response regulator PhoP [Paenibacillus sp. UNCCL117]